jgi:hypothetical protein
MTSKFMRAEESFINHYLYDYKARVTEVFSMVNIARIQ